MLINEFQICLNIKREQYLRPELTGKEEIIAAMENFEQQHQKFLPKFHIRLQLILGETLCSSAQNVSVLSLIVRI